MTTALTQTFIKLEPNAKATLLALVEHQLARLPLTYMIYRNTRKDPIPKHMKGISFTPSQLSILLGKATIPKWLNAPSNHILAISLTLMSVGSESS